jgi:MFS family permease
MWSIAVVLPTLQADFGVTRVTRADVSLAYTAMMLGAVVGGPLMGWLSDRFGCRSRLAPRCWRLVACEPGGDDMAIHAGARAADQRWYLGRRWLAGKRHR